MMSELLLSEMRYSFNPEDSQIWYPEIKNSNGPYIKKRLLQYKFPSKYQTKLEMTVPARISRPTRPQCFGWILTMDVRIETAARVKKKFQWTPYSPTWTYKIKTGVSSEYNFHIWNCLIPSLLLPENWCPITPFSLLLKTKYAGVFGLRVCGVHVNC